MGHFEWYGRGIVRNRLCMPTMRPVDAGGNNKRKHPPHVLYTKAIVILKTS